jgi:L-threonylcarbamoyladenylate synthase
MKTEIIPSDRPFALPHAVDILKNGGLVAFPTDTVYGLAALPLKPEFIERLYIAKGRNSERAIAILLGDRDQMKQVTQEVSETVNRLVERFWPGPLTLIVPKLNALPSVLSPNPTIGVRIPDHPVALALLQLVGPLAVTSANLSGHGNTRTAQEVMAQLEGRIHLILDGGQSPGGVPSTVVDCTGPEPLIIREGPVSQKELDAALG